ncbi:unnamed protein product [Rhizoctonia solani]|uniref:Uncharacterized protein n=1 Tax=Rhizoctonia solani TaxID=456999 RepID=A0A8H3GSN1_9AGAM|nr:unnamed protein product [Rhizoctonia solani]
MQYQLEHSKASKARRGSKATPKSAREKGVVDRYVAALLARRYSTYEYRLLDTKGRRMRPYDVSKTSRVWARVLLGVSCALRTD